jgi:glycosyltransferase involved in cell wall biosynthesis
LRLLHVLGERGHSGGEEQLACLLEHLVARGHDNRLVLRPGAEFARTAERLGVPFDEVAMRNGADPVAWWRIRGCVRRFAPELLHLCCSRSHKLAAVGTLGLEIPVRLVTRRMDYPLGRGPVPRWLYARGVDHVVAISEGVRREILAAGVPAAMVTVIHEGVDPARFQGLDRAGATRSLGLPDGALVIVSAASLRPRKGQAHLLRAFAALAPRFPAARLVLAGVGDEHQRLARERDRLELRDVVAMPGRRDVRELLAAADIACIPSLREGLSVFSLEAMAAGVPVVASRVGGLPESVAEGVTGLLAEPGDEAALAAALERLLADRDRREAMGVAARERARERFSARAMAEKTERLYEDLLAARAPR